jgi:hypothetical protein
MNVLVVLVALIAIAAVVAWAAMDIGYEPTTDGLGLGHAGAARTRLVFVTPSATTTRRGERHGSQSTGPSWPR